MEHRTVPKNKRLRLLGFFPESARRLKECSERPPETSYLHLEFEVGRGGEDDAELFSVTIATAEGLVANTAADRWVLSDHGTIIVRDFDPRRIRMHIEEILSACEAPTLHDAIPRLQRYFRWEGDG